ncbi:MAG TPA: hypothetical protein VFJ81_11995, partial [Gemmatimonadales bacterium]|nr:hypothetical protein [Gemmatimonadales bacterium]
VLPVLAVLLLALLAGCGGGDATALLRKAVARGRLHDPCTLVSATEAEPYVGALAAPPYRASDGAPDPAGDQCVYRGRDGRQVTVNPSWRGGAIAGLALQAPGKVMGALAKGAPGLDSMSHMVMKKEAGPWDQATWIPGGSVFATRGETEVQVDVTGASGREADALALARIALPRFAHPLAYDGARAVAAVPRPRPHPAHACDLVPRPAVEAAIGPLDGPPTSDAPESSCTWRVHSPEGERTYAVEVVWQGGSRNYGMLVHGMSTFTGMTGLPSGGALDSIKPPPGMEGAIGGLMQMVTGASQGGGPGSAPGAAARVGFVTDTTLSGPWDKAALLHGTQLIAVRNGAFVGMSLVSADLEKAKALLGAICERL